MAKLIVDNSYSQLVDVDPALLKAVRKELSYTEDNYASKSKYAFPKVINLMDKKGSFPTGLLHRVIGYLRTHKQAFDYQDIRVVPKNRVEFNLKLPYAPYLEQEEIANVPQIRGTVSAVTGFGKSIAMSLLIARTGLRTLIIVPNLTLKQQLTESFTEYFGFGALKSNIRIENIDSRTLKHTQGYDLLLVDEAHHSAAKTYRDLNKTAWKGIYRRYFFTATPYRSKTEEQILFESLAGQVIYEIDYHKAVSKGYVVPVEAYYVDVPKTPGVTDKTWPAVYSKLVVKNQVRNDLIVGLMNTFYKSGIPTLCLVKEITHGKTLQDASGAGFANGMDGGSQMLIEGFCRGSLSVLIGTVGVLGEGTDSKPAEVIIIAGLGKSKPQFLQQVGRGVRRHGDKETCKVIIFRDLSHAWTKAHFKAQCEHLLSIYNIVPTELIL